MGDIKSSRSFAPCDLIAEASLPHAASLRKRRRRSLLRTSSRKLRFLSYVLRSEGWAPLGAQPERSNTAGGEAPCLNRAKRSFAQGYPSYGAASLRSQFRWLKGEALPPHSMGFAHCRYSATGEL